MTSVPECDATAAPAERLRIVVQGIGTARPVAAAAIAKGFGLPAEKIVACLYRAPAVLVDGLTPEVAARLLDLLSGIGLEVGIEAHDAPPPPPSPAHDVAIYVREAAMAPAVAEAVATFLGIAAERAMEMLLNPPGLVLGEVSEATVAALSQQIPADAAEVVASRSDRAAYDLFVADAPTMVLEGLHRDLTARGIAALGRDGLVASGLDYATGRTLWRRHQASGAVRLVNQDFERFDLVLTGTEGVPGPEQHTALTELAGVPEDLTAAVLDDLPMTLEEGVTRADADRALPAYASAGLRVAAELVSFQHVGIEIVSSTAPRETAEALTALGLAAPGKPLPRLPHRAVAAVPELQARMLRAALEQTGATIAFVEAA